MNYKYTQIKPLHGKKPKQQLNNEWETLKALKYLRICNEKHWRWVRILGRCAREEVKNKKKLQKKSNKKMKKKKKKKGIQKHRWILGLCPKGGARLYPKLRITFFTGRRRSERIPFQAGQASADGITRDAEARFACEVAELIGCGVASCAWKRTDASVGWFS